MDWQHLFKGCLNAVEEQAVVGEYVEAGFWLGRAKSIVEKAYGNGDISESLETELSEDIASTLNKLKKTDDSARDLRVTSEIMARLTK